MVVPLVLRCVLTAAFAIAGGYCLLSCAPGHRHDAARRLSDVAHVGMSAAMVAMLWGATRGDRWGLQLTAFALAAGWFATRAVHPATRVPSRAALAHQGVGMAAMCWMLLPRPDAMPGMSMAGAPTAVPLALAGYLALAAVWWATRPRLATGPTTTAAVPVGDAACHALMAAGMTLALLLFR